MAKYRKKPVVIDAFLYEKGMESVTAEWPRWVFDAIADGTLYAEGDAMHIKTLEGPLHVSDGDWIIKGIKGELYPCKPDIFEQTYEKAD